MPILQTRLERLIQAAELYLQRDKRLRAYILHEYHLADSGKLSAADVLNNIFLQIKVTREYDPAEQVITEERIRYNLTHARNVRSAAKMRRRRALAKGYDLSPVNTLNFNRAEYEEAKDEQLERGDLLPPLQLDPEEQRIADQERTDAEEFNKGVMEFFSMPDENEGLTPEQIAAKETILAQRRAARAAQATKTEAPEDEE